MARKKGFFSVPIKFYSSIPMKEQLDTIPNYSEFIRIAIEEKLRRDSLENIGEVEGSIETKF